LGTESRIAWPRGARLRLIKTIAIAQSLSLSALQSPLNSGHNALSNVPEAIALGNALFNDQKLSLSGEKSCASCHKPDYYFAEPQERSTGSAPTMRHAPSLLGAAYRRWLYWDGRRDTLWAQALTPLETKGEMDNTRTDVVRYVSNHAKYAKPFRQLTGIEETFKNLDRFPTAAGPYSTNGGKMAWHKMAEQDRNVVNNAFVAVGKIIAAYERTLMPGASRFDEFVSSLSAQTKDKKALLNKDEIAGLKLFISPNKTNCLQCHNGPLFTNEGFHNIATGPNKAGVFDYGRAFGLQAALFNPFNCRSHYSDDQTCDHVVYAQRSELPSTMNGAFKVPSLRNVAASSPYMHDGRFSDLTQVVAWYLNVPETKDIDHELQTMTLTKQETQQLIAFLKTLTQTSK